MLVPFQNTDFSSIRSSGYLKITRYASYNNLVEFFSIHRGNRNRDLLEETRPFFYFSPLSMHARLHIRWHESSKTARRILHSIREKILCLQPK